MNQVSEEVYLTKGRVVVRGQLTSRGDPKRADYVLYHKPGIPLAVVEAKDNTHTVGDGMQQALGYADLFDVPFAFSSSGNAFLFHDPTASPPPSLYSTPSPTPFSPPPTDFSPQVNRCLTEGIN